MSRTLLALRLRATTEAPAIARNAVESVLRDDCHRGVAGDALLVVSEMVSNAVRHGPDDVRISLDVVSTSDTLHISVTDLGLGFDPERQVNSGFGLGIIDALASEWGVVATDDYCRVWCELSLNNCYSSQQLEALT